MWLAMDLHAGQTDIEVRWGGALHTDNVDRIL